MHIFLNETSILVFAKLAVLLSIKAISCLHQFKLSLIIFDILRIILIKLMNFSKLLLLYICLLIHVS